MKKHMVERHQDLYVGIDNDMSARREHGKTPQGNELNGRWVLRDSEGNWIDHDQYRADLFSRHGINAVEPGYLLDEIAKYKARIAELEAELIAEAKKTASEKLRADQMTEQHRMQAKMHAEARDEIIRLKTAAGTSAFTPTANALQINGLGEKKAESTPAPTPWYPDDSGAWVEVPEDLMEMPKELKPSDLTEALLRGERENKEWWAGARPAVAWGWCSPFDYDSRIVAYKVVTP